VEKYFKVMIDGYIGYANYFCNEILNPGWYNYFYWLIAASLLIYLAEISFPWRKNQNFIRDHFWLNIE
jgi:hypothetical protein